MVFRDHFGGGHDGGRQVGDVALRPDQGLRAGQAGLVEDAIPGVGLDEAAGLDGAFAVDDLPCPGLLGVEGFLVAAGTFGRVGPDRPPRCGVGLGFQTGSARWAVSVTLLLACRGVTVSMICPSVKTSPFQ